MNIMEHQREHGNPDKCLIKKCSNEATVRGLCPKCYGTAKDMIRRGKVLEESLLEKGMILPSKTERGTSLFLEQLGM